MDTRCAQLLACKRRKASPEDGPGLHVVVVDELALYLATGDRKAQGVSAGPRPFGPDRQRKSGRVIVLAATQRPSSDIISTSFGNLSALLNS